MLLLLALLAAFVPASAPLHAPMVVAVDTSHVVNSAFQGLGYDLEPFLWEGANLSAGFDESDWRAVRSRLEAGRPRWVIVAVAAGWFHPAPDQWDWDSPSMRSLYRYLDLAQELDIHVQLLGEWFQAEESGSWYLEGSPGSPQPGITPTRDPRAAAEAYSTLLRELLSRGYTAVRAIALTTEHRSFEKIEALYTELDGRLRADGLRDKILLAGPNASTPTYPTFQQATERLAGILDVYSYHNYWPLKHLLSPLQWAPPGKPVWLTEFGWPASGSDYFIGLHMAEEVLVALNGGVSAALAWTAQAHYRPHHVFEGGFSLWRFKDAGWLPKSHGMAFDLMSRFVDRDSQVLSVTSPSTYLRAAALRSPSGLYTVALLNLLGREQRVQVAFSNPLDTDLYRYLYDLASATRPETGEVPSDGRQRAGSTLEVTLPAHSLLVLTDQPDPRPLELSRVRLAPAASGEVELTWQTARPTTARVEWTGAQGSRQQLSQPVAALRHQVPLQGLVAGTQYRLTLTAVDDRGNESLLQQDYAHGPSAPSLPAVAGLHVLDPAARTEPVASPNRLTLEWEAPEEITLFAYRVYRSPDPAFAASSETLVGTTELERWVDVGLDPGAIYYYRVAAMDCWGREGPASEAVEGKTPLAPTTGWKDRGAVVQVTGSTYRATVNRHTGLIGSLVDGDGYERLYGGWMALYESTPTGTSEIFGPFQSRQVTFGAGESGAPRVEVESLGARLRYDFLPDRIRISAGSADPRSFALQLPLAPMAGFQAGPLITAEGIPGDTIDAGWQPGEANVIAAPSVSLVAPPSSYRFDVRRGSPGPLRLGPGPGLWAFPLWIPLPAGETVELVWSPIRPSAPPPGRPDRLEAREAAGAVSLSWSPPSHGPHPLGYLVFRDGNQVARVREPGYLDSGGAPGGHRYAVAAYDAEGRASLKSDSVHAAVGLPEAGVNVAARAFGTLATASDRSGRGEPELAIDGSVRASQERRGDHDGYRSELQPVFPIYFSLTLPAVIPVDGLELRQIYAQDIGITRFNVQVSEEGLSWRTVAQVKEDWNTNGPEAETKQHSFPAVATRYLRLEILAANLKWDSFAITELAVRSAGPPE